VILRFLDYSLSFVMTFQYRDDMSRNPCVVELFADWDNSYMRGDEPGSLIVLGNVRGILT
jgi:hypothetical protein